VTLLLDLFAPAARYRQAGGMPKLRLFISYRTADVEKVEPLAARLRAAGIDAFLDRYEIRAGDVLVEKLEAALGQAEAGLILLSNTGVGHTWTRWELSTMMTRRIEEGFRLVPVLVDPDAPVPLGLRSLRRVPLEDVTALVEELVGPPRLPVLGDPDWLSAPRTYHLRIEPRGDRALSVALRAPDRTELVATTESRHYTLDELMELGPPTGPRRDHATAGPARRLTDLGRALGALVFPANLAAALPRGPYLLQLELAAGLSRLPVEAAWVSDGRPLALEPGVTVGRIVDGAAAAMPPAAGPLRVLVMIATTAGSTELDTSDELARILDALEGVRRSAEALVLDGDRATLAGLREAIGSFDPHVVHLSTHGRPGALVLADGAPVTPDELARSLTAEGSPVPLVVLSACSTADPGDGRLGFAEALVAAGVPQVIAMLAPVGDSYATELASALYQRLVETPVAVRALSAARREVEATRRERLARGEPTRAPDPEYGTPVFVGRRGSWDAALFDPDAVAEARKARERHGVAGLSVSLGVGEFVGRHRLRDRTRAALTRPEAHGALLWGMGGIGKSSLAVDLLWRLDREGWAIAVPPSLTAGAVSRAVLEALVARLPEGDHRRELRGHLAAGADQRALEQRARRVLATEHVALVLDDLHEHTGPDRRLLDRALGATLVGLAASAARGAVLVTSRCRLPEFAPHLAELHVGPLTEAELRLLLWRLPSFGRRPDGLALARGLGGHPRVLELADALLRTTSSERSPRVEAKLRQLADAHDIDLPTPEDGEVTVDDRLAVARSLAAADVTLELLLERLSSSERAILRAVAVYDRLVPLAALEAVAQVAVADGSRLLKGRKGALEKLTDLTLLGYREDHGISVGAQWAVHRWTAEEVWRRTGGRPPAADRAAAHWWLSRPTLREDDVQTALEHLLAAKALDEAIPVAWSLVKRLSAWGRSLDTLALCERMVEALGEQAVDGLRFLGTAVNAYVETGRFDAALRVARRVHRGFSDLAEAEPTRADLQRDLAVSLNKLGDLHRDLGNGAEARTRYEQSLRISERLAEAEPTRADLQRDLAVSLNKLGDLHSDLGNGAAARTRYEQSLRIRERLAEAEPTRADLQRDLSVSQERLGDLHRDLGNGAEARTRYEQSLRIRERLAEAEPTRADLQRDLSVSQERLGDLHRGLGNGAEARTRYEQSLRIRERLAEAEPTRADLQRDLSVSQERLGDLHRDLGNGAEARTRYEQSLRISERLAEAEPTRADLQRDLAVSLNKLGDLHRDLGNGAEARTRYEQSLRISERLAEAEPTRADLQRDLAVSLTKLGDLHSDLGNGAEARTRYEQSLRIIERLAEAEPTRADLQRDLSVSLNKLGDLHRGLGNGAEARTRYEQSLRIIERLAEAEPTRADLQRDLAVSYERMAIVADPPFWLPRALAIRRAMAVRMPDDVIVRRELAIALLQAGQALRDETFFREGATLLVVLYRAGVLEAQYHKLAEALD
jgi:tetratricopeptide (TPR) repeat protein